MFVSGRMRLAIHPRVPLSRCLLKGATMAERSQQDTPRCAGSIAARFACLRWQVLLQIHSHVREGFSPRANPETNACSSSCYGLLEVQLPERHLPHVISRGLHQYFMQATSDLKEKSAFNIPTGVTLDSGEDNLSPALLPQFQSPHSPAAAATSA